MTPFSEALLSKQDEMRLRELANGIVRGIETAEMLLDRLGFTSSDYTDLSETRMFRQMLTQAQSEWEGASNTHKRIKLKAAVNIEEALPHFYRAMTSEKEPLSSKVKAFEVVSRVAGLGMNEPVPAGTGQFFKLEINLGGGVAPITIGNSGSPEFLRGEVLANGTENIADDVSLRNIVTQIEHESMGITQSGLFDNLPLEEL